jgi:signal transduction histidine kinase
MNISENFFGQLFTFNNPLFLALIISLVVLAVSIFIFWKFIYPLQKRFIVESQRYLLERAELMALFSEMDPDPLIRINADGDIIQTNESCREVFQNIEGKGKKIWDIIPLLKQLKPDSDQSFIETIDHKVFSIRIKRNIRLGFANVYLHDITTIKKYEYDLEDYKNRLKLLTVKLENEYENLKKALSSELHDDIGQKLIVAKLKLSQENKYKHEEVQAELEVIYQRIREIARNLKTAELDRLGLSLCIQSLVYELTNNSDLKGSFEFFGTEHKLEPDIELSIFRIAQEGLNNIIKHSNAEEFKVLLEMNSKILKLTISDDGVGMPGGDEDPADYKNWGTGLFSISEKAQKLKGVFKISSTPFEGTILIVQIPIG